MYSYTGSTTVYAECTLQCMPSVYTNWHWHWVWASYIWYFKYKGIKDVFVARFVIYCEKLVCGLPSDVRLCIFSRSFNKPFRAIITGKDKAPWIYCFTLFYPLFSASNSNMFFHHPGKSKGVSRSSENGEKRKIVSPVQTLCSYLRCCIEFCQYLS